MKNKKRFGIIGLAAIMVIISLAGCSSNDIKAGDNDVNSITTDVVVIGSGGAGLSAALEVKNAGKDVIVLEKMPIIGGNTLRATGGLNAAGTTVQATLGLEDNVEAFFTDTMKGGYDKNDPELVQILAEESAEAVEWLLSLGGDFKDVGKLAGATNTRAHRPTGGAPVGPEVVKTLRNALEESQVTIMTETIALKLIVEDGRVSGVIAEDKEGKQIIINATSVVLATGGFGANATMLVEYNKDLDGFGTTNHSGATGDGISMAQEVGAALVDIEEIQTHPTAVPSNGYMITEAVRGNGAILVNRNGERFVDELATRDVVSAAMLAQEGKTGFLFFDQGVTDSLKAIDGYIKQGIVTEAETLEELAEKTGINPENLKSTVADYNQYVAAKKDEGFGRNDMPRSLENAKYYAIEVGPAVHHTMGGVKINAEAQVLNNEGIAIEGLYAAGEVTGGVHGGNRLGGNALTDLIVFGRIAGRSAVKN